MQEGEQEIILRLLEHVAENDKLSQAKFADRLGSRKVWPTLILRADPIFGYEETSAWLYEVAVIEARHA